MENIIELNFMATNLEELSREELYKVIDVYAKAWQAMDSCYFLALEEKSGIDTAIEMDI